MSGWQPGQYDPRQQPGPGQWNQTGLPPWNGNSQPQGTPPQYYQQPPNWQPPYGPPPRRKSWPARHKVLTGIFALCGLVIIISVAAAAGSSSSPGQNGTQTQAAAPPAHSASAAAGKAPSKQTITYEVTGSEANVTYGPAGSNSSGTVPMNVTDKLATPLYYSITAQLQGSGSVTCKLKVNGKVISTATANGGYNVAQCEISRNPFTGDWKDTLQG